MHGRGPSSKMRPQLQPKKTKVRLTSRLYSSKRRYQRCTLLTRRSTLVLKVGVSYGGDKAFKGRLVHSVAVAIAA